MNFRQLIPAVVTPVLSLTALSATRAQETSFSELALERRSRHPVMPVPLTKKPPVIDGRIGYREWGDASVQNAFVDQRAGVQNDLTTTLYLKYDEEALFLGVLIERPRFAQDPKADFEKGKHKHIWWGDDNFEIFLIPGERAFREREQRLKHGIELSRKMEKELGALNRAGE